MGDIHMRGGEGGGGGGGGGGGESGCFAPHWQSCTTAALHKRGMESSRGATWHAGSVGAARRSAASRSADTAPAPASNALVAVQRRSSQLCSEGLVLQPAGRRRGGATRGHVSGARERGWLLGIHTHTSRGMRVQASGPPLPPVHPPQRTTGEAQCIAVTPHMHMKLAWHSNARPQYRSAFSTCLCSRK